MRCTIYNKKMFLALASLFLITVSSCKKEKTDSKPDFIAPKEVQKINDITYFKQIQLGAQTNEDVGSCINLKNGYVYDIIKAGDVQSEIDMVMVSGSSTGTNLISPASSRFTAWGTGVKPRKYIYDRWWVKNLGTFMNLPGPTEEEVSLFTDAGSVDDLLNAFNHVHETITKREGYSKTNDGPQSNVRRVSPGDVVLFHSEVRRVVAIMMVDFVEEGGTGMVQLQIKSGTF